MQRKMQREDRATRGRIRSRPASTSSSARCQRISSRGRGWRPRRSSKTQVDRCSRPPRSRPAISRTGSSTSSRGGNLPFNDWMLQSRRFTPLDQCDGRRCADHEQPLPPLDKQNTTKQQETVLDTQNQLDSLNYIKSLYSPDYLTRIAVAPRRSPPTCSTRWTPTSAASSPRAGPTSSARRSSISTPTASGRRAPASEKGDELAAGVGAECRRQPAGASRPKLQTTQQRVKKVNIRSQMALRSGIQPGADRAGSSSPPSIRWMAFRAPTRRDAQLEQLGYPKAQVVRSRGGGLLDGRRHRLRKPFAGGGAAPAPQQGATDYESLLNGDGSSVGQRRAQIEGMAKDRSDAMQKSYRDAVPGGAGFHHDGGPACHARRRSASPSSPRRAASPRTTTASSTTRATSASSSTR